MDTVRMRALLGLLPLHDIMAIERGSSCFEGVRYYYVKLL